jgi:hypothetical protein
VTSLYRANTFPVLSAPGLCARVENGIYRPRDASDWLERQPYVSSYNGFIIPNFVTIGPNRTAATCYVSVVH